MQPSPRPTAPEATESPRDGSGRLLRAIDWFVPRSLHEEDEGSLSLARTVTVVCLSATFWGGGLVLRNLHNGTAVALACAVVVTGGLVLTPFVMRWNQSLAAARSMVCLAVYAGVAGSALSYGGWRSPVFIVLAALPAVAIAMRGDRLALGLLGLTTAVGVGTFAADGFGWWDFGAPRAETHFFLAALVWFVLLGLWFVVLWAFQRASRLSMQELERSNEELSAARDAADAASHAKSAFLANMSHEIRTPLNGVLGLTEILEDTRLDEQQRQLAERITLSARSLLEVINQVLDYSKLATAEIELEERPFDLERPLGDVIHCLAVTAEQKGLELTAFLDPALPRSVSGDEFRVRQVLMNLVGNAIKFTERGEVNVRVVPAGGAGTETTSVAIEVSDTGIGCDAATVARLFHPFAQADESTTRRFGGTGLGLAISAQLAECMGGGIEVESAPGRGSTFRFRAVFGRIEGAEREPLPERPRVLVVEPQTAQRRVLEDYLGALEIPFASVASPEEEPSWRGAAAGPPARLIVDERIDPETLRNLLDAVGDPQSVVLLHGLADSSARVWPSAAMRLERPVLLGALTAALWPEAASAPAPARANRAHFSGRVLVAEDNPVNQIVTRGMLEALGCEAIVVADGREAVEAFVKDGFDLVLLDLQMPVMDGVEATRRIRGRDEAGGERTPIVAISADLTAETRERAVAAGIDAFVPKPFSRIQLAQALSPFLEAA